jgi:hypothetical protein
MRVNFDCEFFMAATNTNGSITVHAEITTLDDSSNLLKMIAQMIGTDNARRILEIELSEAKG